MGSKVLRLHFIQYKENKGDVTRLPPEPWGLTNGPDGVINVTVNRWEAWGNYSANTGTNLGSSLDTTGFPATGLAVETTATENWNSNLNLRTKNGSHFLGLRGDGQWTTREQVVGELVCELHYP